MDRLTFLLICILLVGLVSLAEAATLISRSETATGVHIVYLVEGEQQPVAVVEWGRVTGYTAVQDGAQWRATISASLDRCQGALRVDGVAVVQQRCVWLPVVIK